MSYDDAKKGLALFAQRNDATSLGRSVSDLGATLDQILAVAEAALKQGPTSFNSQATRMVVLVGGDHQRYWETMIARPDFTSGDRERIQSDIEPAMGTILFFADNEATDALVKAFPTYAAAFPGFAEEGVAMAVGSAWTAISTLDKEIGCMPVYFGTPLQGITGADAGDAALHPEFPADLAVPATWQYNATLVFGSVERRAMEHQRLSDNHRVMEFSERYTSIQLPK